MRRGGTIFAGILDGFERVEPSRPPDAAAELGPERHGFRVGDLTHGIGVAGVPVPGLNFGTDMQGIFNLIGTGYKLVTVDGRAVDCANPLGL